MNTPAACRTLRTRGERFSFTGEGKPFTNVWDTGSRTTRPEVVSWEELGWHDDADGWHPFRKVRGYQFGRAEYFAALRGTAAT